MLQLTDRVNLVKLKSQHDKEYTLINNGIWLITKDKATTEIANRYFNENKMPQNLNLIVDASKIPSTIFYLFARPKMQHYKHPILLSFNEEYNLTLPFKKDMLTLLYIKDTKVQKITYIKNYEELEKALK
jgi:hypothetical protein